MKLTKSLVLLAILCLFSIAPARADSVITSTSGVIPSLSDWMTKLDGISAQLNTLLDKSTTNYYLYGFVAGMSYERSNDLNIIGSYAVKCATAAFFVRQATSTVWSFPTCTDALSNPFADIARQNNAAPAVVPGF